MEPNCLSVRASLWEFVDGSLDYAARSVAQVHLEGCRECDSRRREIAAMRCGLRQIPALQVPRMLSTRLLVSASRERARRFERRDLAARMRRWRTSVRLFVDNLLKPFAVPAAGGILTSFLCFGMIIDGLHVTAPTWDNDIPIGMFTEVAIDELSPFSCGDRDVMVQLTVDETGSVTDYSVPTAHPSQEEMREIGNLVLYSTFTPATRFGQAISSKRLFDLRHISVKG